MYVRVVSCFCVHLDRFWHDGKYSVRLSLHCPSFKFRHLNNANPGGCEKDVVSRKQLLMLGLDLRAFQIFKDKLACRSCQAAGFQARRIEHSTL